MYYNYTSFYVMEDGNMIRYAVEYSYGRRSPSTYVSVDAWCVWSDGDVNVSDYGVTDFYGRILRALLQI